MSTNRIVTPKATLSFPHLFTPQAAMQGGIPKYSASLVFDSTADLTALKEAATKAVIEKWPDLKTRPKNLRTPFRDGAEKELEGYGAGKVFINITSKNKPLVVDADCQPIIDAEQVYPGCVVRASVTVFTYSNTGNNGVSCGLSMIQKIGDGKPLGGAGYGNPEEVFGKVAQSAPTPAQANTSLF